MRKSIIALGMFAALGATAFTTGASASDEMLNVTVTNVTSGQVFAPVVVATHKSGAPIFSPGAAASPELVTLAETGGPTGLVTLLQGTPGVVGVGAAGAVLHPGESVTITVEAGRYVSIAGMLVVTNDGFVGLNGVRAPKGKGAAVYHAAAWDGAARSMTSCATMFPVAAVKRVR